MRDVQDEPLFCERVAGLDIAKAEGEVTIGVPSDTTPGHRQQETRTFGTTRAELESLADWLRSWGVTRIGMEATSDYWRPFYYLLEAAGLDVQLINSRDVKNVPGRPKTDKLDCVWQAKCTERGMLRPSFVPPTEIRQLRDYARLRLDLTRDRSRQAQREHVQVGLGGCRDGRRPASSLVYFDRLLAAVNGEYQSTEAINAYASDHDVLIHPVRGQYHDCGHPAGWLAANNAAARASGITIPGGPAG